MWKGAAKWRKVSPYIVKKKTLLARVVRALVGLELGWLTLVRLA